MTTYDFTYPTDLAPGERVELHPSTDRWMQGDRFGVVSRIGRKWVSVRMDRSGQEIRVAPAVLGKVV